MYKHPRWLTFPLKTLQIRDIIAFCLLFNYFAYYLIIIIYLELIIIYN